MNKKVSTDPYKGTRDFYPKDMAILTYIFDTWSYVAELFGYEQYDASVLEPAELYKSKSSEEIVAEQTYTFKDRGDREVTLRPEMTPTVARMIAKRAREINFPARWYSIPNLFRYERPQRGRLREHWQLNCDIFGTEDISADIEMIALGFNIMRAFGADPDMFEIRINDRAWMEKELKALGLTAAQMKDMFALLDRKEKIDDFDERAKKIIGKKFDLNLAHPEPGSNLERVINGLGALGITNVAVSPSTVRGFTYYTGTVFEFFDTSGKNNRSLIGGGRYDNLTAAFGGKAISGVGFGMGDVTLIDFLETHDLLTSNITAPTIMVIPTDGALNIEAEKIAQEFRNNGVSAAVDMGDKKLGKKISAASDALVEYVLVLGEDELAKKQYAIKNLISGAEDAGSLKELIKRVS